MMIVAEYTVHILSKNLTKIENILTQRSVAQTGSTDEKNWRSKISLYCPFKHLFYLVSDKSLQNNNLQSIYVCLAGHLATCVQPLTPLLSPHYSFAQQRSVTPILFPQHQLSISRWVN